MWRSRVGWGGPQAETSSAGVGVASSARPLEGDITAYNRSVPKPLRALCLLQLPTTTLSAPPSPAGSSPTQLCSVHPFPDPSSACPLCPQGGLVLGSGSSHPGAPSITSYPSSQLPPASAEHGPSGISEATKRKDQCGIQTAGRSSQGRACSGEPCGVVCTKVSVWYQPVIIQMNDQPASPSVPALADKDHPGWSSRPGPSSGLWLWFSDLVP